MREDQLKLSNSAKDPDLRAHSDYMRAQHLMARLARLSYKEDPPERELKGVPFRENAWCAQWRYDENGNKIGCDEVHGFYGLKNVDPVGGLIGRGRADAWWGTTQGGSMGFIVVRGTDGAGDKLADFFSAPTLARDSGGPSEATLHQGFSNYADAIYDALRGDLGAVCARDLPYEQKAKPLWLAGHSLGGAVATILAQRLAAEGCNVRGVVTFGSPKPGLKDFQQLYNQQPLVDGTTLGSVTSRWVNFEDPFPCLAPMNAWRHVGMHNTIDGAGVPHLNDPVDECQDPDGAVSKLKKAAAIITGGFAIDIASAIADWLNDRIILRFICNDNAWYDEVYTLGACSLHEEGTRLKDAYLLDPIDVVSAVVGYYNNEGDHSMGKYSDGLHATFIARQGGEGSGSVTVRIPTWIKGNPPTIYDTISGDTCLAELDETGDNWVCTFNPPLGGEVSLRLPLSEYEYSGLHVSGCSSWGQATGLTMRCDVSSVVDTQIRFQRVE